MTNAVETIPGPCARYEAGCLKRLFLVFACLSVQGTLADDCESIAGALRAEPRETRFERYRDAVLEDVLR